MMKYKRKVTETHLQIGIIKTSVNNRNCGFDPKHQSNKG